MANINPVHPGEHLEEFLEEFGVSAYALARVMNVPQPRLSEILHGRRSITADTSARLGKAFGQSPSFWLRLQNAYDLQQVDESIEDIAPLAVA